MSSSTTSTNAETPAAAGTAPANADLMSTVTSTVLPFIIIFVVFYFLILRPQQKKFKLHQAMVAGIQRGDEVVTSGGIIGKVKNVDDSGFIQVEIASGVVVKVLAATISSITNDQPVNDNVAGNKKL